MKRFAGLLLIALLALSLIACGTITVTPADTGNKPGEGPDTTTAGADDTGDLPDTTESDVPSDDIVYAEPGDEGEGETTLYTKFGSLTVPEGMGYEVSFLSIGEDLGGTVQFTFNKVGHYDMETLEISTTRMISNADDAVEECKRMNKFNDNATFEPGPDVTYGGITFKQIRITPEGGKVADFLVTYYQNKGGHDTYVEMKCTEDAFGNMQIPIDDPMIAALLGSLKLE